MNQVPNSDELSKALGQSLKMYTLLNDYIDCYYQTDAIWGKSDKHGIYVLRHRQGGKTLCTIYINEGYFTILLVYSKQEQSVFESSKYHVNFKLQVQYDSTYIYPEGKWIWLDIYDDEFLDDIKHFISVKRKPDEKAITMCGSKCNLCRAYAKNIKNDDQREQLSAVWKKYYDFYIPKENIYCDGCRCSKKDAKLVDTDCPVRKCVIEKQFNHCGECPKFPCETFAQRAGLCCQDVKERAGADFNADEFANYLLANDNKTRLHKYIDCRAKS